jgi:hypothetical protein
LILIESRSLTVLIIGSMKSSNPVTSSKVRLTIAIKFTLMGMIEWKLDKDWSRLALLGWGL